MKEQKIQHPKFGHVIFYNVTPRQKEVIEYMVERIAKLERIVDIMKQSIDSFEIFEEAEELLKNKSDD